MHRPLPSWLATKARGTRPRIITPELKAPVTSGRQVGRFINALYLSVSFLYWLVRACDEPGLPLRRF